MVKVVCGKSRIGEASYRGEGMGQIVVGENELGGASWTRSNTDDDNDTLADTNRHTRTHKRIRTRLAYLFSIWKLGFDF